MSLPPLRTIRDTPPPSPAPHGSALGGPHAAAIPGLNHPRLPPVGRTFLAELVGHGLLAPPAVAEFLAKVGDRVPHLGTRERTGDALTVFGYLTKYQRGRVINGNYHGLALGGYRVIDRLGGGSVGVVFLGEHAVLRRRVAIKVMPADDSVPPDTRERFGVEARLLAAVQHPNVAAVYDAGVSPASGPGMEDLHYTVLEYVPGGDLEQFVYEHGRQPVGAACGFARDVAAGLRAAHDAGIVHRDLKPSNLLLTAARRVKIVDFGLARDYASVRTPSRVVLGSLDFAAPEQFFDATTAGPAADVYGLGVTLFWMLTGQLPYPTTPTPADAARRIREAAPPARLRDVLKDVPGELDELMARMLARNPADRPPAGEAAAVFTRLAAAGDGADNPATELDHLRATIDHLERAVGTKAAEANAARATVLTTLAAAAARRPGESNGHQRRVRGYVRMMAARLADNPDWPMLADPLFADDVARAAAAHDIGLTAVPDEAITTLNPPTPEQQAAFDAHPAHGCDILDDITAEHGPALPFLRVLRAIVRHHHEKWDGTGTPDRLADTAIPPAARLAAVADAYDDLRRGGFGRPPVGHIAALNQVRRLSGVAFDPTVVTALFKCGADVESLFDAIPDVECDVLILEDDAGAEPSHPPSGQG